ncbi:MAG: PPC domain-containing protein [Armatimonadaceae bacterium]
MFLSNNVRVAAALICLGGVGIFAYPAAAQTLRPRVQSYHQLRCARGGEAIIRISGVQFGAATGAAINAPGITVVAVTAEGNPARNQSGTAVVKLNIAENAQIGSFPLRVATQFGVSDPIMVVVEPYPEVPETEPNNTREAPGTLKAGTTVTGTIDSLNDIDTYQLQIEKGDTWVVDTVAGRIGSPLVPSVRITNSTGRELAFQDTLANADPRTVFTARESGTYYVTIRDARYKGGGDFRYRVTAHKNASATGVFPRSGQPGKALNVRIDGPNAPLTPISVMMPELAVPGITSISVPMGTAWSQPIPFFVDFYGTTQESEPNDRLALAMPVTVPIVIDGRIRPSQIGNRSDTDLYRVKLAAGQVIEAAVDAEKLGSPMDPVVRVLDASGGERARDDDSGGSRDAKLVFTAPAAGEYLIEVTDAGNRSGDAFIYRLQLAAPRPDFAIEMVPDAPLIIAGGRTAAVVNVTRSHGYNAEIPLTFENLPAGVRVADGGSIPAGAGSVRVIFEAAADAKPSGLNTALYGTGMVGGIKTRRFAVGIQEDYSKNGDQVVRATKRQPGVTVGVSALADVVLTAGKVAMQSGVNTTIDLPFTLTRHGFAAKITLSVSGLPAGVTASGLEVAENATSGVVQFKVDAGAAAFTGVISLVAKVSVDELRWLEHCSQPISLVITK